MKVQKNKTDQFFAFQIFALWQFGHTVKTKWSTSPQSLFVKHITCDICGQDVKLWEGLVEQQGDMDRCFELGLTSDVLFGGLLHDSRHLSG